MSAWQELPMQNFCLEVKDGTHDSPKQTTDGKFLVTSKNIKRSRLDLSTAYLISEKDFHEVNKRSKVDKHDILLSMIGTVGDVCIINEEPDFAIKNVGLLKCKNELQARWLYYYLLSSSSQQKIKERLRGTTQQYLPLVEIRKFPVLYPSNDEAAQNVVELLKSLDDKIDLNQRMNETLEAMARALFKSWFVDFDPVRAKAEGRKPEGMDAATAALFPAAFNDDGLPKGWDKVPFSRLIDIIGGGTPKTSVSEYWNGTIPWFSVVDAPADTDIYVIDTEKKITQAGVDNSSTKVLPLGTTIISARGTVGRVALVGVPMAMNQSCYAIRGNGFPDYFTYFAVRQLVKELKVRTHGSVFDTITRDTFDTVSFTKPNNKVAEAFDKTVASIMQKVLVNLHESKTLSTLRDVLLPKLITGELRVDDAVPVRKEAAG